MVRDTTEEGDDGMSIFELLTVTASVLAVFALLAGALLAGYFWFFGLSMRDGRQMGGPIEVAREPIRAGSSAMPHGSTRRVDPRLAHSHV